jgi:hypothetical protein
VCAVLLAQKQFRSWGFHRIWRFIISQQGPIVSIWARWLWLVYRNVAPDARFPGRRIAHNGENDTCEGRYGRRTPGLVMECVDSPCWPGEAPAPVTRAYTMANIPYSSQ